MPIISLSSSKLGITNAFNELTKKHIPFHIGDETILKEYGYVHRKHKSIDPNYEIFDQNNYYYLCDVENKILEQQLDDYENFEKYTLELVDPRIVININRNKEHGPIDLGMIEREAKVLELLIKDGYFN